MCLPMWFGQTNAIAIGAAFVPAVAASVAATGGSVVPTATSKWAQITLPPLPHADDAIEGEDAVSAAAEAKLLLKCVENKIVGRGFGS